MAFRFQLEMLSRLRRSLERQQELLLQVSNHEVQRTQNEIRNLEQWREAVEKNAIATLRSGTAAAELLFDHVIISAVTERKLTLQKQLLDLQKIRDQRRTAFGEARHNREIIEKLRDQQLRAYRMDQTRKTNGLSMNSSSWGESGEVPSARVARIVDRASCGCPDYGLRSLCSGFP